MPAVAAISQPKLFEQIGYAPHSGQTEIHEDRHRFQVVVAGRRFGKSELGGHRLVTESFLTYYQRKELADRGKRREFWIVGPNYSDAEKEFRVLYNTLSRLKVPFDKPGTYYDPIGGNMHISLWEGRFQVHAKSAAHPESLVGEGLHGVVLAEAAKIRERVWTKYVRPTLNDYKGWSLATTTPEGKNWIYDQWQLGQDPSYSDWMSWRMPSWRNPFVYPGGATSEQIQEVRELQRMGRATNTNIAATGIDSEIGQLILGTNEVAFNQEIGAEFTEYVGRVFAQWDEETHVGDFSYDPRWNTYACVDWGFTNPSVWLRIQVDPFGEYIRVIDEVYERNMTPEEFGKEVLSRNMAGGVQTFYPDPASPGDTRVLENVLKVRHTGGTGGELSHRLDAIRGALKPLRPWEPGTVTPRLMVDRKCVNLIREMDAYRYPDISDKNRTENPLKKDDHAPEALGRFFQGHFGSPAKQAKRARVRASTMKG